MTSLFLKLENYFSLLWVNGERILRLAGTYCTHCTLYRHRVTARQTDNYYLRTTVLHNNKMDTWASVIIAHLPVLPIQPFPNFMHLTWLTTFLSNTSCHT